MFGLALLCERADENSRGAVENNVLAASAADNFKKSLRLILDI
jgi:hypothetical protein